MLGAGTVINPIIKIVTTVAVLAAAYFFIVKPVLETTDKAIDSVGGAQANFNDAFDSAALNGASSRAESYASSLQSTWPAASREIKGCISKARNDAKAMERCADSGQTLVQSVQSDRTVSLSHANSVAAQGDSAGAARIETCVKAAGFKPAAMDRCRNLADQLLFG